MNLTKRMQQVLDEEPETTKFATVMKMADLGIVTITDKWIMRNGTGDAKNGVRSGRWVVYFKRNAEVKE